MYIYILYTSKYISTHEWILKYWRRFFYESTIKPRRDTRAQILITIRNSTLNYSHANCTTYQYWYISRGGLHDPRAPITRHGEFINTVVEGAGGVNVRPFNSRSRTTNATELGIAINVLAERCRVDHRCVPLSRNVVRVGVARDDTTG